ncbi:MAG: DNA topoisomerase 3 [Bacteroidales bacterium]|nr:DNA topoisomerase 3 [Bacteroidales bacterium]MBO7378684.1 DNA topoisomerase 3 [Bacteroidales bacterium]
MKVCIAEKPSVAQSIAGVLGATSRQQGYYEGNGYQVTWTFGHLCELKAPEEYTPYWKAWAESRLPMIPQTFGITLKDDDGVRRQFAIIADLYSKADEIINCGDAGQEGELIQRWVMQKAGIIFDKERGVYLRPDQQECPVYRLWINSMTDDAIKEGFQNLRPQQDYDLLYRAGLSRAIGDWLLGMNASRLYTVHYGHREQRQVISIGRVQTPTLALIVKRHWEIANFQPTQYWEIKTLYRDVVFNATKGRYEKKEEAEAAIAEIDGKPFTVTDIQKKQGKEQSPRLYDLTSLQVDCNRKFGFSADDTLKLIQSLYEKKLTTYPRVDTTYLSDDIYPKCPLILKGLRGYEQVTAPLLAPGTKLTKSKKVFDNSKVTDHHAIIPTGVPANTITPDERKVYDLVSRRFIAVFYPECVFNTTTVNGFAGEDETSGVPFRTSGKVIVSPGWRTVYADLTAGGEDITSAKSSQGGEDGQNDDENQMQGILPEFVKGESGPHIPSLLEKWTKAPPLYSEATLLRAMETAGKLCDDEELRDAMKENGLGRPSTRAAIIETLFRRHYIRKEKKALVATQTGIELIGIIQQELLKSAELTGQWEKKLRQIERGDYDAHVFIEELKAMVCQIVEEVIHDSAGNRVAYTSEEETKAKKSRSGEKTPRAPRTPKKKETTEPKYKYTVASLPQVCPVCGVGRIVRGRTAYGCTNYANGCTFRISFDEVKPE